MLTAFSVGNFLSFKDIQTLNLVADALKEHQDNLHRPYLYSEDYRLLKSVAIYGHNSHGKSNLLKAFKFFQNLVLTSFVEGQTNNYVELEQFRLNIEMKGKPSLFEINFLIKDVKYRYRILITSSHIVEEELYYAPQKIRENYLFERKGQEIKYNKQWSKDNNNRIESLLPFAKPNILLLSVFLSQAYITGVTDVGKWLNSNLVISDNHMHEFNKAKAIYSNENYTTLILKFISRADLGFTSIFDKIDKLAKAKPSYEKGFINFAYDREIKNFDLFTNHSVFDGKHRIVSKIEFELLKDESAGTIKYFVIVCLLAYAIKHSQLIWIDELDARLHTLLLEMLISSFHDSEINPINAQLIFTTHNTHLLDRKLRRDQMVVIEKNEFGESSIKRVHTVKSPVRIGKSLEKEYKKGKLGGISKRINDQLGPTLFDSE